MNPDQTPDQGKYLIDPNVTYKDERSIAVLALDQAIQADPGTALEVLTTNRLENSAVQYNPGTPHHQFTTDLNRALSQTHNGVGLFNTTDDETFELIANDETFRELSKKRQENPDSEELARRAAYAGLRVYIMQRQAADTLQ